MIPNKKYHILIIITLVAIAVMQTTSLEAANYVTYHNSHYGYSISYPVNVMRPQGESPHGDGQVFKSNDDDAALMIWGEPNEKNQSIQDLFKAATMSEPGKTITQKHLGDNWFEFSGTLDDKMIYQKTAIKNGIIVTFKMIYFTYLRDKYVPIAKKIADSFKP